jgi:large subunit ribosomal protein L23
VKVEDVRTLIVPGKVKRMGRFAGKTPTWKKAVVRLKKDQSIAMFES